MRLLSFIGPIQSNVYDIFDPIGFKLPTPLPLCCSHLNEHKFRQNCLIPLCSYSLEIEDAVHSALPSFFSVSF